jgi:peptide/nickel transport system ATP-binding protein
MIAMALSCSPSLLIADEPTTALDVTIQAQILDLMKRLRSEFGSSILIITHDMGVVADLAERIVVMYAGRVVEEGPKSAIFRDTQHPYTWGLLGSIPRVDRPRVRRLAAIPGAPPSLLVPEEGCQFAPRCPHRFELCTTRPELLERVGPGHWDACHLDPATRPALRARAGKRLTDDGSTTTPVLLEAVDLVKHFPVRSTSVRRQSREYVHAVDGVSLEVRRGETLGIVGESGCGKSTLGRLLVRLHEPTSGTIRFDGTDITSLSRRELRPFRREMQMIFQDPYASLNPRKRVGQIVGAPFQIHHEGSRGEVRERVQELLEVVGLSADQINRYPHEFSGGQRQRIGVARALALNPRLIVADEPVSALDVSIQAQVVNLLDDLQDEFHLTYVFIAHDLGVVRHVSDRIAVMYLGVVVESAPVDQLFAHPIHPYSEALLSAIPEIDTDDSNGKTPRARIVLEGEVPSPIDPPSGCRFHPRCRYATDICRAEQPMLARYGNEHLAACHHPLGGGDPTIEGG